MVPYLCIYVPAYYPLPIASIDPGDHICLFSRSSPIEPRDHISLLPRGLSPPRPQLPTCRHAISCDTLQHPPSIPYCPCRQHLRYRQRQYRQHQYCQHQYRQHQYRQHQYRQHQYIVNINIVNINILQHHPSIPSLLSASTHHHHSQHHQHHPTIMSLSSASTHHH